MTVDRQPASSLLDRPLELHNSGDATNQLEIRCRLNDELLAIVSLNDVFDKHGNRFYCDLS